MKNVMIALLMTGGLLLVSAGCGKEGAKDEKAGAAASGDKIGVAECDEYIAKYPACIAKMPEVGRAAAEQGFKNQKDAWRKQAANPQTKDALQPGCKAALEALSRNALCK